MTTEYKGFTIKVFGIGQYTMHLILERKLLLVKVTMYPGTSTSGATYGAIRSIDEGLQLGKSYVDNHRDWLLNKYKLNGQNATKRTKDRPYCLSSCGSKTARRMDGDYFKS